MSSNRDTKLLTRLWVSAPLTAVVVALSMFPSLQFPSWQWVVAALTIPVVTWGALPFHATAWKAARHGSTTMDTLVSLGVIATTLWSLWALFFGGVGSLHGAHMDMSWDALWNPSAGGVHIYFEGAATIVCFLLLGRTLESRAKRGAGDALRSLLELGAKSATVVDIDDSGVRSERQADIAELAVGDLFVVRPGEKVATDGEVVEGASALDTSLLTGESLPVDVSTGDLVTGATVNTWGTLLVRATRVGAETTLARIGQTLADAQSGKAPIQRLADRISGVFVPVVLVISALTFVGWMLAGGGLQAAMTAAVSVLVVACPCALGLATPTALLVGSGRAAQLGVLIRTPEVLENTRRIDTLVVDKTGTVTTGQMSFEEIVTIGQVPHSFAEGTPVGETALGIASGLEALSEHPVARAIVAGAAQQGISPVPVEAFTNHPGLGVSALLAAADGTSGSDLALIGRLSWCESMGVGIPQELRRRATEAEASGASAVVLAIASNWAENHLSVTSAPEDAAAMSEVGESGAATVVQMSVDGMTCASCVRRVERKLGKLDGVSALVNLATESATITLSRDWSNEELEAVVDAAGYSGRVTNRIETGSEEDAELSIASPEPGPVSTTGGGRILPDHLPNARAVAVLIVRDTIKAEATEAVASIKALGLTPLLVTGDNLGAANHVAAQVGIEHVHAGTLPEDKRTLVEQLQADGHVVAVVGDGVNDAAALAQAGRSGLGMAMGSGTDVAIDVAEITLVTSDLTSVATAIRLSRQTLRIIKENLFWAFAYNVAMIPLAILGLLNPMIASAAMAFSSVFVVLNSLRLKRAR